MLEKSNGENEIFLKNEIIRENKQHYETKKFYLELSWKNLSILAKKPLNNKTTKGKKVFNTNPIKILDNVYGNVKSGEALAILGGSGAGKTTLLNFLSKKIESKNLKIEGEIILNNQKIEVDVLNSISS